MTQVLPDIKDLADADVVVYDGDCVFCQRQVRRLHWFAAGRLAFVSLHDPRVAELCPGLSQEDLMKQMYVVTTDGEQFGGASAVRYLSRKLPRLWLAAPFLHIPFTLPIWQFGYEKIANSRYQIAGSSKCEDGACRVR